MTVNEWNPEEYDRAFSYVSSFGGSVLELLDPKPGEKILDLGCGSGELAAEMLEKGVDVSAVDADEHMIAKARQRLGDRAFVADGHAFRLDEPVDAVFSNAALHWMTEPEQVVANVRASLRDGGRFVGEMGGKRNIGVIAQAVRQAVAEVGGESGYHFPWYFPSPAEYTAVLEAQGLRPASVFYFPRLTPLDPEEGVRGWVRMFGDSLVAGVPQDSLDAVLDRVEELCRDRLFSGGRWHADYWRLRFEAVVE